MSTPDYYAIKFTRASKKYLQEALQIHLPYNPDKYAGYLAYVAMDTFAIGASLRSPREPVKGTYEVVSLREFKQICFIYLPER